MVTTVMIAAAAFAQAAASSTDCSVALARNSSTAIAQVCLAEAELDQARAASMAPERRRHLERAAALYKRALALPADEVEGAILEVCSSCSTTPG